MFFQKKYAPAGSRPGTLVISEEATEPSISLISYDQNEIEEFSISNEELLTDSGAALRLKELISQKNNITWIDIQGLGSESVLKKIAELFELHLLTIADVVNVPQRPKTDLYDTYSLSIGFMAKLKNQDEIDLEQISVIWSDKYVITFQERFGDILDPVRERIRKGKGPIRKSGNDYLAYAIIDTTIDGFYPVLEQVGEKLEDLEGQIINSPDENSLQKIYKLKRELLSLRRIVWPQREAINHLAREENDFVKKSTRVFFRDTYDHIIQIIDVIETYRELAGSFMDVYLSSLSNKMNEVMKVLTIIGTIFIPLSFFAGIFGMNFEYMPELKWKWAYPTFWIVMLSSAATMIYYFKKKGWIGKDKD